MRVQVAYDRAVRNAQKALSPANSRLPRSPFDGSPRSLRFPNRKPPSRRRIAAQVVVLALSVLIFVHALVSFIHEFRYRPLKHWKTTTTYYTGAHPSSSVSLVLACNTSHLLSRSVSSFSKLQEPNAFHGTSIVISTSLVSSDSVSDLALGSDYTLLGGEWSALAAVNLAASKASTKWLLLLPCGCSVPNNLPSTVQAHTSPSSDPAYFVRHANPYDYCSYTALVRKRDFFRVRGVDERGQAPCDPSLMQRLASSGININGSLTVDALDFDADSAVSIAADEILQKASPPWEIQRETTTATSLHDVPYFDEIERAELRRRDHIGRIARYAAEYTFRRGAYYPRRRAISHAAFIEGLTQAPKILSEARQLAHRHVLRARYDLPLALSNGMPGDDLYRLLTDLAFGERTRSASVREKHATTTINGEPALAKIAADLNGDRELRPKIMVVQPMHGLGNRLRALASARTYARNTRRLLVVVWERDAHCLASWNDLFSSMRDVFVTHVAPQWPPDMNMRADPAWIGWSVVDYMDVRQKDAAISAEPGKHIILRSAFVLRTDPPSLASWADINVELRALIPSETVAAHVAQIEKEIIRNNIDVRSAVGVHVRSRKVEGEIVGAKYTRNATALLSYWRGKSSADIFLAEMNNNNSMNNNNGEEYSEIAAFVVACDTEEGRAKFRGKPNVAVLKGCEGRAAKCVQVAFAEMHILARTKQLLASPWSSFSEVIERLGGFHMKVAGIDFAADHVDDSFSQLHGESVAQVVEEVQRRRTEKILRRRKRRK